MNDAAAVTDLDWSGFINLLRSVGIDFGLKLIVALIIFYVGRIVAKMLQKGIQRLMQAQETDKILESFVSNLAYWVIMIFVIIAAINQIGVQTSSLIAVMGAASSMPTMPTTLPNSSTIGPPLLPA